MIKTLLSPFKRFAWFKRLNAKITYEWLARHIPANDWQFMNYGYYPNAEEPAIQPEPKPLQLYPLLMYHYLGSKAELAGKVVLEVGSGRGGGAAYLASHFKPAQYTGMDLAQHAVDLANKIHAVPNLKFIQGSAENIPLPDNSVDVVINVESCHAYGSVKKFLSEVKRALKPGGYFLMVDFRYAQDMPELNTLLRESGMSLLQEDNITANVVKAIEAEDEAKQKRIRELVPPKWQKLFAEFAGVVGSKFYRNLNDGTRFYYRYVMQK
ncbi:MAG: class I SAM-dependent methyltransferase [Cyclobacteriaceae bacterium]|nr:class I SAM-dependent methyltransferase [Cyclobacteriaceae bacterium]